MIAPTLSTLSVMVEEHEQIHQHENQDTKSAASPARSGKIQHQHTTGTRCARLYTTASSHSSRYNKQVEEEKNRQMIQIKLHIFWKRTLFL
jgi:hypothetical protein